MNITLNFPEPVEQRLREYGLLEHHHIERVLLNELRWKTEDHGKPKPHIRMRWDDEVGYYILYNNRSFHCSGDQILQELVAYKLKNILKYNGIEASIIYKEVEPLTTQEFLGETFSDLYPTYQESINSILHDDILRDLVLRES